VFAFVNYAQGFELMMDFTIFYVQFPANSMGTANFTIAVVMKMLEPDNQNAMSVSLYLY
jgi:hypothetical protein